MSSHQHAGKTNDEVQELRAQAGRWLRGLREAAGLSQRELAKAVGFDYYTFISQLEGGRGRLPPAQYAAFASALNVPLRDFVKTLMRYYDTITYEALFGSVEEEPSAKSAATNDNVGEQNVTELAERIARLEALLSKK